MSWRDRFIRFDTNLPRRGVWDWLRHRPSSSRGSIATIIVTETTPSDVSLSDLPIEDTRDLGPEHDWDDD